MSVSSGTFGLAESLIVALIGKTPAVSWAVAEREGKRRKAKSAIEISVFISRGRCWRFRLLGKIVRRSGETRPRMSGHCTPIVQSANPVNFPISDESHPKPSTDYTD